MPGSRATAFSALMFLFSCASAEVSFPQEDGAPASAGEITPEEIQGHVDYLASDALQGRGSGTAGCDAAAKYLARTFREAGLEPAGEGGTYFQEFQVVAETKLGEGNGVVLGTPGSPLTARIGEDCIPYGHSGSGSAEGPLVFVGYGITSKDPPYDDYAGLDVKGKIVVALRHEPQEEDSPFAGGHGSRYTDRFKATSAKTQGAAAILLVMDPKHHEEADTLPPLRGISRYGDVGIPAMRIRRGWFQEALKTVGQDLQEMQEAIDEDLKPHSFTLEGLKAEIAVEILKVRKPTRNVVGRIPGTDPELRGEVILFGAHYDHLGLGGEGSAAPGLVGEVHNGADDNASGTSGLIELAEAFGLDPEKPRRTLIFVAFSGEELGLKGSAHFVENPPIPMEKGIAMFNFDMIGRSRERKVTVDGTATGAGLKEMVEAANEEVALNLSFSRSSFGASDHVSFLGKDIPVLFFFTGAHSDYHRPSDDADKIDSKTASDVMRLAYKVARDLDEAKEAPAFIEPPPPPKPPEGVGGFRAYLGTVPDFTEVEGGVRLADVTQGSPGDEGGLRPGDLIIRLGDRKIENLYDFTYALQENKPGDVVEVEIVRGGEKMTLEVTLGRRGG